MELIPGAVNCVGGTGTVFGVVIVVILLAVFVARFFGGFEFGEGDG